MRPLFLSAVVVLALAYRSMTKNQELMYDRKVMQSTKKYGKPEIFNQRKIKSVQGRSQVDSLFGLPCWEVCYGDGKKELVYSRQFPSNYVLDRS